MAAAIIQDEIKSRAYDKSKYPDMHQLRDRDFVPPFLTGLLDMVFKTKCDAVAVTERQCISIAQSITSTVRPHSCVSPILLGISVYINRKLESCELIDILSNLSFTDDYREVQRLYDALLPKGE